MIALLYIIGYAVIGVIGGSRIIREENAEFFKGNIYGANELAIMTIIMWPIIGFALLCYAAAKLSLKVMRTLSKVW